MSQRLYAACAAVPLVLGLMITAALMPLPYVAYAPGSTIDVLAKDSNEAEIIQVQGRPTYRDDGSLRMTTVLVTPPRDERNIFELLSTWFDGDDAVYPYGAVYDEAETPEDNDRQGAVDMVSSQDSAIAVALTELGEEVEARLQVAFVEPDSPADGVLRVRDILRSVDGTKVESDADLRDRINDTAPGETVELGITRNRRPMTVSLVPRQADGRQLIGITPGVGFVFPFDVSVNIDPNISGPSAGLMFSLAIYDTLTPGSLTDGRDVAGTGEIAPDGTVGPIGGIQQKVAAARRDGIDLFFVPEANCEEALTADNGDVRLVMAQTMHDSRLALEDWVDDPDAQLPSCQDAR